VKSALVVLAVVGVAALVAAADDPASLEREGKARLEAELAAAREQGRPAWLADVPLEVQITNDYRQMRRECDGRTERGQYREALKMLYALADKGEGRIQAWARFRIPEGLVAAKEFAFAILELRRREPSAYVLLTLGRCYLHYCQFGTAAEMFQKAAGRAKSSPQENVLIGQAFWGLGDVLRRQGHNGKARAAYRQAFDRFRAESQAPGKPAWYCTNMKKYMQQMRFMMELCDVAGSGPVRLRAGTYRGQAQGYDGPIVVSVTVSDGAIQKVEVTSERESRPYDSLEKVPAMIVERQSPSVDAVTGATVTSVGVMGAVLRALQQAR